MKPIAFFATSLFAITLSVAAVGLKAAVDTSPTLMSPVDFTALKRTLEAETRLALAGCREALAAEREMCRAEARAAERVKRAEINARYFGTVTAMNEAQAARAKAGYDVARARCTSRQGEARADCLRAARVDRNKLLAEARLQES